EQYMRLVNAKESGDWYGAKELLNGLEGYRDVNELAAEIQAECIRLDNLVEEALDALANKEPIRLIKTTRLLGSNIPDSIKEQTKSVWEALPLRNHKRMYQHLSNGGDVTLVSI